MPELQILGPSHPNTVQPPQPNPCSLEPAPSGPVVPAVVNSADNDDEVHGFLPKLRLKRYPAVAKTFSLLIFFLSVVALWASVSSAVDSQKATSIAEWTSKKDFFLYCEDHDWDGAACENTRNATLNAPPGFSLKSWRRRTGKSDNARKQQKVSNTTASDLQEPAWLFRSLLMGLLLRHRRVQRKLRNFIRRWSLYTNLLKATKAVQKILALVGRHRERYGRDEEQAWGLLNVSPGERDTNELHQTHIDSDSAVEGAIKSIHVTTDEDEDWSASAAEFEVPQVPKSKLQDESEGTLEWWEKGMMACHFSLYLVYHAARSLHPKVYHEQHQS